MAQLTIKKSLEVLANEMKNLAAEWEQGVSTWEDTCGYANNEELLPFLTLPSEGEYIA